MSNATRSGLYIRFEQSKNENPAFDNLYTIFSQLSADPVA